jgi:hypothetical protein
MNDSPEEVVASINGLVGAELQRALRPLLCARGWDFNEAWAEDHGWDSEVAVSGDGKTFVLRLVTCPELDAATPEGGALDNRWRVVIGGDLGLFPKTRAHRVNALQRLARDLHDACLSLGAQSLVWEVGGP